MILSAFAWLLAAVLLLLLAGAAYSVLLAGACPEVVRSNEICHVTTPDLWKLRVCRFRNPGGRGEPVLFVHGLNANQNNFLNPAGVNGNLVEFLKARGYDCWTVDLRTTHTAQPAPGKSVHDATVDDYAAYDIPAVLEHICRVTGWDRVHYVGHSLGGFLLYAHDLHTGGRRLASAVTLGSPVDFAKAEQLVPPRLRRLVEIAPWTAGELLRLALPLARRFTSFVQFLPVNAANLPKDMDLRDFYTMLDDPSRGVHRQIFGWADAGEVVMHKGKLRFSERLPKLNTPLLAAFARLDPFINSAEGRALFDRIEMEDKKLLLCGRDAGCLIDYSHCDLAFGANAAAEVFTPVAEWIAAHPITPRPAFAGLPEEEPAPEPDTVPAPAAEAAPEDELPGPVPAPAAEDVPEPETPAAPEAEEAPEPPKKAPAKRKAAPRRKAAAPEGATDGEAEKTEQGEQE